MRDDLMGLELGHALDILAKERISAQITQTDAPRRAKETGGVLRVVYASEDAKRLTVARFLDPLADAGQENE